MSGRSLLAPIASAGAALAGCAHSPPPEPVALTVSGDASSCGFEAEGRALTATALAAAARGWRGRKVLIFSGLDVPCRCFALATASLERGGHDDVTFIAEPPHQP